MVKCLVNQCLYHLSNDFCGKRVTSIDENGHCKILWRKGQPRPDAFNRPFKPILAKIEFKEMELVTDEYEQLMIEGY